jgi:hypothetical protein
LRKRAIEDQDEAQKIAQPGEDAAEIVANGGEDDVGGIASAALEIAAAEVAFGLQVADHGLDGGSVSQPALDHSEDAALLAGNEDAAWNLRVLLAGLPAQRRENVRARKVRRIVFSIVFRQPSPATLFFKLIEVETKFPFANSILEFYAAKSHCGSQSSKCTLQGRLGSRRSCWPRSKAAEGKVLVDDGLKGACSFAGTWPVWPHRVALNACNAGSSRLRRSAHRRERHRDMPSTSSSRGDDEQVNGGRRQEHPPLKSNMTIDFTRPQTGVGRFGARRPTEASLFKAI